MPTSSPTRCDTFTAGWDAIWRGLHGAVRGRDLQPDAGCERHAAPAICTPISETLVNATPLILGGLSVGLAFRAGLFNIGGQGQIIIGAICAGYVGFAWHLPAGIHLIVALIAGIARRRALGRHRRLAQGAHRGARGHHDDHAQLRRALPARPICSASRASRRRRSDQAISNAVDPSARLPHLLRLHDLRVHAGLIVALLAAAGCLVAAHPQHDSASSCAPSAPTRSPPRTAGMSVERSYIIVDAARRRAGRPGRRAARSWAPTRAITQRHRRRHRLRRDHGRPARPREPGGTVLAGLLFGAPQGRRRSQMQSRTAHAGRPGARCSRR